MGEIAVGDALAKELRRHRWVALHEDEEVFGLVASEYHELARLNREFGHAIKDRDPGQ